MLSGTINTSFGNRNERSGVRSLGGKRCDVEVVREIRTLMTIFRASGDSCSKRDLSGRRLWSVATGSTGVLHVVGIDEYGLASLEDE